MNKIVAFCSHLGASGRVKHGIQDYLTLKLTFSLFRCAETSKEMQWDFSGWETLEHACRLWGMPAGREIKGEERLYHH